MAGTLLLALVGLPLAGCDSSGANGGAGDGGGSVAPPGSFSASVQTDGDVALSWSAADDADAYTLYRSTSPIESADGTPLAADVSGTSYTDGSAQKGQVYYYRATSTTGDGTESALSSEVTVETPDAAPGGGSTDRWTRVKTATDNTIHDVAVTAEGAYAVAENGLLLKRDPSAGTWRVVLSGGPSSNSRNLYGLAVTDDGTHLWFVGASGAVGEYDVTSGSLVEDHSGPNNVTNNFQDVAVTGDPGAARVYVSGGSGQVYYTADDGGSWTGVTPGSGSALRALDTYGPRSAVVVDANQTVFETTDGGSSWADRGIADADRSFYGVDANAADDVWVAAGSGTVYRWDGASWTSTALGEPDLEALTVAADGAGGYAVGGSGAVFTYDGASWARQDTPTAQNLEAVVPGTTATPPIAVGAGGTVIER
jgi:hypothetical protein